MSNLALAAKTVRGLAIDAIEKANSGHPGLPMGMADAAVVLWTQFLKFDPAAPHWPDRDRFVLSAGHGSALLYSLLHLAGYEDVRMDDLQSFRQWGAKTAGHPEYGEIAGVETTTGPLGQGLANAVGMALAEQLLAGRYNSPEATLVDHYTYAIAGDGCLMEGVASEAASLAGHLGLGKLVVLYDDNGITIDGPTLISFSEDVAARFEAMGWHCVALDGHDQAAVAGALRAAQAETDRPSLLLCKTHIGYGAPTKQGTSSVHGSPLGAVEMKGTKEAMGWPTDRPFYVPDGATAPFLEAAERGQAAHAAWREACSAAPSEQLGAFVAQLESEIPAHVFAAMPRFEAGTKMATRKASGKILSFLAERIPQLLGGSADLTGSNQTQLPAFTDVAKGSFGPTARYLRYGIREHGMGAIMNGLSLHGGWRPYGGTFLVFSDYLRPTIRLAAMMGLPIAYVFSHDSVFLGEDGPTHQPIEHAMSLRLIPNCYVLRPGDANETAASWQLAMQRTDGPCALLLTRHGLPVLAEASTRGVLRGAYVIRKEKTAEPARILLASGSELPIALGAADILGPDTRVVSVPCFERFDEQSDAYKAEVLPPNVVARAAIEAGITWGWERYVGARGIVHGIDRFGVSAPWERIASEWGFTPEAFAEKVRAAF